MLITGTATYTIGSAGSPGTGATSGNPGSATSFTFNGQTITGGGGGGGLYNTNVAGAGGTFSGGKGGAAGGNGSGSSGDSGGGGGGGVGGTATPGNNVSAGDHGAALTDVSGLAAALTALGYNYTSTGLGGASGSSGVNNRGTNATGVGCGGGGAGYYGGDGGNGYFGGGGGGASGYGQTWTGGSGGSGFVAIKRLTSGVVAYDFLTTSGSYVVPTGTTEMKVWAVGAGGGGAGSTSSDSVSGGAGGAGGLSFLELGPILSLNFNAGDLTATGSVTLSADQTLTYPSSGGVSDSGYATGWNITQGIRLSSFTTPASTLNKTYVAWYKGTQTASGGTYSPSVPIFSWTGNDVWWGFGISAGKITVANASQNMGTTNVATNQWVMLAWTVTSGGSCNGFVNGVKEVNNISVNTTYPGAYKIGSGYNYAGTEAPTALDAIEIYEGILTDSEILAIYTEITSNSNTLTTTGGTETIVTSPGQATVVTHTFDTSGTFTITAGIDITATMKVWGAGGGGTTDGGIGGGGGYSTGIYTFVPGNTYTLIVGQGGGGVVGNRNAGGGGGGTGLQFAGNTTPIIVAGGGGGGAQGGAGRNAGAGGGATGGAGAGSGGAGGTQSAPGAGGSGSRRTGAAGIGREGGYGSTGSQSSRFATGFGTGGWGSYNGGDAGSGGGGGGYWGGGEGGGDAGGFGGGGGSGYVHPTLVSSGVTTAGSGQTAGNSTDSDKATAATGGIGGTNGSDGVNSSGFDGKFIISYSYYEGQSPGLYVSSTSVTAGGTVTATLITTLGNAEIAYAITGNVAASGIDVPFNGNISVVDGVGSLTIATTVNPASRSFPNNAARFGGNVVVTQLNNSNTQVIYTSFNNQKLRTQSNQEIAIGRSLLYGKVNGYSESTTAILTVDADRARIVNNLGVANITTALDPMVYFVITSVPSVTSIGVKTDRGVGFFEQGETGYYRAITDQNDPRPIVIPGTAVSGPKQYWY